jgi:class 3 adenylate cyclase
MITCPACGQENPEIARFCLACATPLDGKAVGPREERRVVSVVFVDLVGFTARSEQLDPEDVRAILNPYYETVKTELESFGGVVEKFIGDAVMAVFGAPTAHGDDPERAVRGGLAVALDAKPGSGEAMIAGDVVNTAARLQQTADVGTIVVGEETYRATNAAIDYQQAQPVMAKGKASPLSVWQAVGTHSPGGERVLSQVPFVGRKRELELLDGLWERSTLERRPHLVTVIGTPGVGKTRLAFEFIRRVENDSGIAVRGRCLPYREHSAYFAFATQIKSLAGIYDTDDVEVAEAKLRERVTGLVGDSASEDVVNHLSILLGLSPAASAPDRESLFLSARFFIEAVSREQPTLLVFEDIHWADPTLLDLIEELAARLNDLPLLILALARHELLDSRPWGGGLLAYTALPLEPLVGDEARQLAGILLAQASTDGRDGRADEIAAAADGNPLFIEQLAAVMSEGASGDSLPSTIRGLVAARLDALPPAERQVVLDAAVVGKTFWGGALERMGHQPADLQATLAALERRDLLRREPSSSFEGEDEYLFRHVLIREVAYELLPRAERQKRHAAVAAFVEELTPEIGEAAAALGRHWRDAGNNERAAHFFAQAAAEAERGWAKDLAVMFYREALELTPDDDGAGRRFLRGRLAVAQQQYLHLRDMQVPGEAG